ncbi:MAG: hypothetical protein JSS49_05125 [Planctomycetes bacterium]|nr:hypothetical protein [Planctomycetota bacterium]
MPTFFNDWQSVAEWTRRWRVRIVIAALLVAATMLGIVIINHRTHQRQFLLRQKFLALGGFVSFKNFGPTLPHIGKVWAAGYFARVQAVQLENVAVPPGLLSELKSLKHLDTISLAQTHLSDADLKEFQDIRSLVSLSLSRNQITDAGLENLKGLPNLRQLILEDTLTTAEGRASLRKVLPKCKITPDP